MMEWISVKDRLPERDGLYLTANRHLQIGIITFLANGMIWRKYGATIFPTHWMPLPEPPKPETEGD